MQRENARWIMVYYRRIPDMLKVFRKQKEDIELESYNTIRAMGLDGMPHGSSAGNPVEAAGIAAAEKDTLKRLKEIEQRIKVLEKDSATIRRCLDSLNGNYKNVAIFKLVYGYSWTKVSVKMGTPDSTCRYWLDMALDRLGECFDSLKEKNGLLKRASRAR